ncbi:hypothetical protein EB118_11065 [bacterium]|nr:hypothetical protein [bacterium]
MTWNIRRTDRRMNGHEDFDYVATVYRNGTLLIEARNWCWQTWGPSCELTLYYQVKESKYVTDEWCWHTEFDNLRIYLKSSKEANWFKLKWL